MSFDHLFSYAFRPFFLLAAAFAIVAMAVWVLVLGGAGPATLPASVIYWHAHEMLVGFGLAAVAGFSLTAVATWTGRAPIAGLTLMLLVVCWLLGRVAFWYAGVLPARTTAVLDMAFPVLLTLLLAREVLLAGNNRNFIIVGAVAFCSLCNGLFHASLLGAIQLEFEGERIALYLLLQGLLFLITVIGGRIVPAFTRNWLQAQGRAPALQPRPGLDRLVIAATALAGFYIVLGPYHVITGWLAGVAGVLHAVRLLTWHGYSTASEPLLLVLHVAYLFLPLGYLLTAVSILTGEVSYSAALHAHAVGAVAFMILAVFARVSLGHTGRPLRASRVTVIAFVLMGLTALVRVLSPPGPDYLLYINIAAAGWILSFGLFLWTFLPILLAPQLDSPAAGA